MIISLEFVENTIQNHIDKFDAVFDKGITVLREMLKMGKMRKRDGNQKCK